jgi:hypothetical protein
MAGVPNNVGVRTGALIDGAGVEPPIAGMDWTRESVDVAIAAVRIPGIPTVDCVEATIVGTDDGALVDIPIVGVVVRLVVAPTVEMVPVDVVLESVVVVDAVVPREVSAGSIVAEGPTPSFAAKELKSVDSPSPRVASKASKSGSDETGVITVVAAGTVTVLKLGTAAVVVPMVPGAPVVPVVPPTAVPVLNVEVCANATQGVAMSATGAIHRVILFIPPPCRTRRSHRPTRCASSSARRVGRKDYTVEELSKCFRYGAVVTASERRRHHCR